MPLLKLHGGRAQADGSARLWPVDGGVGITPTERPERPTELFWELPGTPFEDGRGRVVTRDPYDAQAGREKKTQTQHVNSCV